MARRSGARAARPQLGGDGRRGYGRGDGPGYDGRQRTFRIVVNEWPRTAGIDSLHKLIDRDLDDNVAGIARRPGTPVRRRPPFDAPRPRRDSARDAARD